jgi:hypothetical protein
MDNRLESLLDVSELLTGFSRVELLGTGMTERYLQTLESVLPPGLLAELLAGSGTCKSARDSAGEAERAILDDLRLSTSSASYKQVSKKDV